MLVSVFAIQYWSALCSSLSSDFLTQPEEGGGGLGGVLGNQSVNEVRLDCVTALSVKKCSV